MRVVFTVSDWTTHWRPMIPLGWALQAAGLEVRVICPPYQTEPAVSAGLTPVEILHPGELITKARMHNHINARHGHWPYAELPPALDTGMPVGSLDEYDPQVWMEENAGRLIGIGRRNADAAVEFARWWQPDLVMHDLMSLEGPLLGRVLDIPAVLSLWGPVGPSDEVPGVPGIPFIAPDAGRSFQRYGVGEMSKDVFEYVLDSSPAAIAVPVPGERLPMRYIPYNGPGPFPTWLREPPAKPRVCVVWGTSVSTCFGPVSFPVPRLVEALSGLDVEVVFTVTGPDSERIGELPANMRSMSNVPLNLLLRTCDLVVHHGGGGAATTGLAAGIPQLALPPGGDQEAIGARLEAAGVALSRHNAEATAEWMRESVEKLLGDPAYRETARSLAAEMAAYPTPAQIVGTLQAVVDGRVPATVS
jgi:UDP:flavonoid glycosyltransferase YjiC (YdhE family)